MNVEGRYALKRGRWYYRQVGHRSAHRWTWVGDVGDATTFAVYEAAAERRLELGELGEACVVVGVDHQLRGGQLTLL